ncbi:MAG: peptidyl-prolyl cis-trans isomerase [Myxococcota bacterium]
MRHGLTAEQAGQPLADIGDETITLGEFAERLADQSPYLRARFNTPERRREFLDNLIRFELLAQEAERQGIDELPSVRDTRNRAMIQQLMREEFGEIGPESVSEEDVRAYYESNRSDYNTPAQVRARAIAFSDVGAAQAAIERVRRAEQPADLFRQIASEQADEEAAARLGDLGFLGADGVRGGSAPNVPAPLAEAAFALDRIGDFSAPIPHAGLQYVVMLTGRRAAMQRTLEEASRTIRLRLAEKARDEAMEAFVARLRAAEDVEINAEALQQVRVDLPEATP